MSENLYKLIYDIFSVIFLVLFVITWIAGIVLAVHLGSGWDGWLAIFPPYGWYIIIEHLMIVFGVI